MSFRLINSLIVLSFICCSGCDSLFMSSPAEFKLSERTKSLHGPAKNAVQSNLLDKFGTPVDMKAWERFPINYGSIKGKVKEPGSSTNVFSVSLNNEHETLPEKSILRWLTGSFAASEEDLFRDIPIESYSSETGELVLAKKLSEDPKEGDQFIINPGFVLKHGRKLYMTHCLHCHGVSGDGKGPTSEYLNPRPRDYRDGVFKFTSTLSTEKVSHADLQRIVKKGIPGTYMPSFMLLKDDELEAILSYVQWLASRGELEKKMVAELEADFSAAAVRSRIKENETSEEINKELQEFLSGEFGETVDGLATEIAEAWTRADSKESLVVPKISRIPDSPESRKKGRELYLSNKAKCATCHGPKGIGNGPETKLFRKIPGTNKEYDQPGLFDMWDKPVKPRNLTRGIYRGGRRPIDLYSRVYSGIKGTPMPAFAGTLTDEEIWHLTNYVMSVPFEGQSSHASETEKVSQK
jgi:mono/diheme cytochrome c family protein